MGGHYEKDIMKQLQDTMARLDNMEESFKSAKREHKQEIKKLKENFAEERKKYKAEIKELKTEVKELKAENAELKKENAALRNENSKLRSQLNNDSRNSSLPPSTDKDGKGKKRVNEYNGRTKSNKSVGAQDGHKRHSLSKSDVEKILNEGKAEHIIKNIGKQNGNYQARYILDYKIVPIITEYRIYADENGKFNIPAIFQNEVVYGDVIRTMAVMLYSEGVMSNDRICDFIKSIGEDIYPLSTGSIYNFINRFSKGIECELKKIKDILQSSDVLHTDATVVTNNGKQAYIRNQSTSEAVLYTAMPKKTIEAIKENTLLDHYNGILIHDHETALYHFGGKHGECNVHLLRYLQKNSEDTGNSWSDELRTLLTNANDERKEKLKYNEWFELEEVKIIETNYDKIILKGYRQNKKTNNTYAKSNEATLLNRLKKYKDNHLLFIHDNRVPFDNNMSERDLRKCKNRQKMAGGFRTYRGQEMFCRILSVIETIKRKHLCVFQNVNTIISKGLVVI